MTYQACFDFDLVNKLGQYTTGRTGKGEMEYYITPLMANGEGDLSGYLLQVKEITEQKNAEKIRQMLYNISSAVVTTRDTAELIGIIREELGTLVDTTNFYVAFYNELTGMLSTPYLQDESDNMTSWPAAKSLTGYAIMQNRPVLITDKEFPELIRNGTIEMIGVPSACWLGVPLHVDGKAIGAFVVQSYDNPQAYSVKDMEILEFVSDQISLAVQRKQAEADLIMAKENAQESDRLKSAFLANMSHEIRTPMNAIVGFAGMLSDPEVSPEERNDFSRIIQSRSDDLMHIINDLLEISRIESGNASVVKSTISMNAVLEEMEKIFRQKLNKNNKEHLALNPVKSLPDNRCEIITDGYILRQVLSNLIDNAIKYTSKGSIQFGYNEPKNGVVSFYVSDTGVGIAPENQNVIFEHFRQADTPDQHQYGGTGLGLSICKGSLALLGGTIRVESEQGKGSTFHFILPYEAPASSIQYPASAPNQARTSIRTYDWSDKTILLVEDEETNMDFLRIVLKSTKAKLLFARSGSELRKHFDNLESIHVVLLDIRLPDANGWDLTREIKALRPGLPVIAQTAFAMETDRQKSLEAGCDNYISKPVGKQLLLEMLSKYLDGSGPRYLNVTTVIPAPP